MTSPLAIAPGPLGTSLRLARLRAVVRRGLRDSSPTRPSSLLIPREGGNEVMFTMNTEELIAAAGGLDEDGTLRLPQTLWALLEGAPSAHVLAADRKTIVGEIRMAPNGAAVYHCDSEGYSLLSPEELEELLRAVPVGVR